MSFGDAVLTVRVQIVPSNGRVDSLKNTDILHVRVHLDNLDASDDGEQERSDELCNVRQRSL